MNALPINNREKTLITSVETTLYNEAATNRENYKCLLIQKQPQWHQLFFLSADIIFIYAGLLLANILLVAV